MTLRAAGAGHPFALFARSRLTARIYRLLLGAALLYLAFAGQRLTLPFSELQLTQDAAPLMPAVWGVVVGFAVLRVMPEVEAQGGRRLASTRLAWACLLVLGATAVAATGLPLADPVWALAMPRNALCFAGVALLAAVALGARLAWLPVLGLAAATFFMGRNRYDGHVYPWAWLLQPGRSVVSLLVCAGLALVGALAYARFDARPSTGLPED